MNYHIYQKKNNKNNAELEAFKLIPSVEFKQAW